MIDGTDAAGPEDYAGNGLADAASPRSKLRRDSRAASHVTLDAVAEAAGLRKGGVLYHFQTREAMLVALVQRMVDTFSDVYADAQARMDDDPCVHDGGDGGSGVRDGGEPRW